MYQITLAKKIQVINLILEGAGLRPTSRLTGVAFNTVQNLTIRIGAACEKFHDEKVRSLDSKKIEGDEIWAFVHAKAKNAKYTLNPEAGDAWTWTAMDADNRLIVSWVTGARDSTYAYRFMSDLAGRLNGRVQLNTDGLKLYIEAVRYAFDEHIDYAQLVKIYGMPIKNGVRDYRKQYIGASRERIFGSPDLKKVTTSHVERQNLTMRMHMRRLTRKTNGFSKKLQNHRYAIALYFVYYNFIRVHTTLGTTPAVAAGLTAKPMTIEDIVMMVQ